MLSGFLWRHPLCPQLIFSSPASHAHPCFPQHPSLPSLPLMSSSCSQDSGLAGSSVAGGIGLGSCTGAGVVPLGCPPGPWLTAGGQPHPSQGAELILFELQAFAHLFPIHFWALGIREEEGLSERDQGCRWTSSLSWTAFATCFAWERQCGYFSVPDHLSGAALAWLRSDWLCPK